MLCIGKFLETREAKIEFEKRGMKLEKSRDSRNYPRNEKFQEMPLPKREGPCGGLVSEVPMCGTDPSEMLGLSLQGDLASKKRHPPP